MSGFADAIEATRLSIRRAVLVAVAVWQVPMTAAALLSSFEGAPGTMELAVGYLLVAVAAGSLFRTRRVPLDVLALALYATGFLGYLVAGDITSLLAFSSSWQVNLAAIAALLLMQSRRASVIVVTLAVVGCSAMEWALPSWGIAAPFTVMVTQLSILVVLRWGLNVLYRHAAAVDDEQDRALRAEDEVKARRAVTRQEAEDARLLHDTVINTLSAIGSGRAHRSSPSDIRQQCARDVCILTAGRSAVPRAFGGLADLDRYPGLQVHRTGLSDADLDIVEGRLGEDVSAAIVLCARESLRNVVKHAGIDEAFVDITIVGEALRVRITDHGRGFDGVVPSGRGLESSVLGRARALGIDASVVTSPGCGTTVALVAALEGKARPALSDAQAVRKPSVGVRERAAILWGAGVAGVSLVLTLAQGPWNAWPFVWMLLVMGLCWTGAFLTRQETRASQWPRFRTLVDITLVLGPSSIYLFVGTAVAFGTDGGFYGQALAATQPVVLLMGEERREPLAKWALLLWGSVCAVATAMTGITSAKGGWITLFAAIIGIGFCLIWGRFNALLAKMAERLSEARRRLSEAAMATLAEKAVRAARDRWMEVGLDDALGLLRDISERRLDPRSEEVRKECLDSESYLRQMLLVGPELARLSSILPSLLRAARNVGVRLGMRAGDVDLPSDAAAGTVRRWVLEAISRSRSGQRLLFTCFPVPEGLEVGLLCSDPAARGLDPQWSEEDRAARFTRVPVGDGELVQAVLPSTSRRSQAAEDAVNISGGDVSEKEANGALAEP